MKAVLINHEAARLEALKQYEILDTAAESAFDDLACLASYICGTPIALINLIDANRQWFKAKVGLDASELPRDIGFCPRVIQQSDILIIPDTLADQKSRENLVVSQNPFVRFYAGAPLITTEGYAIGTLCVVDYVPRQLNEEQIEAFLALSRQVVSQLELRRNLAKLAQITTEYKVVEESLKKAATENLRLARAVASASDGILITDPNQPDNPVIYTNPAFSRTTGYQLEEIIGRNCRFLQGSGTDINAIAQINSGIAEQREVKVTLLNYRQDGQPFWNELKISPVLSETGELLNFIGIQTDITGRKQAEAALKESEERYRSVVTAMQEGIVLQHSDGSIHACNASAERILGLSIDQMTGRTSLDPRWRAIHEDGSPFPGETHPAMVSLRTGKPCSNVIMGVYKPDDVLTWISINSQPLCSPGETIPYAVVASFSDITQRKQAEENLRSRETLLRSMADASPLAFYVVDNRTDVILYFNHHFCEIWGIQHLEERMQRGELKNNDIIPDCLPILADIPAFAESCKPLQSEENRVVVEDEILFNDGRTIRRFSTQIRDEQDRYFGRLYLFEDISDRQHAEQKIREQAALLNVATDAILVRDLEDKILFWNKSAERIYGWKAEYVLGKNANQFLYHDLHQITEVKKLVVDQGEWQGELHKLTKSGQEIIVQSRWILVRGAPEGQCLGHRDQNSKSILSVDTDITEKKQLKSQFLRAQRMESIGTLAGGIAHDLNNVLAPILMSAQLMQMKMPDKQSQRLLKTIETNAKRGGALVKQVLSFARGIEGKRTIIQVRHLIFEIRQIALQTFPKSIEFSTALAPELWSVLGDATQLHQVLMNLCVNARDAMPDGGTLSVSAENIIIDEHYARMNLNASVGAYILITVTDTGTGITPEILDKIFEPFFTTKEQGKGTGLGLSTTSGIIKSHGGFVNVYSELGKGT
jgi:PAS domain S-box-containing protein